MDRCSERRERVCRTCGVESAVRGLLAAASERQGRGAARAALFIKEPSYAAVATVPAPAADGKAPSSLIYLQTCRGQLHATTTSGFSLFLITQIYQ